MTIFNNYTYEQAFRKIFTDEYFKQPVYFPAYSWLLGLKEGIIYDLEILAQNFCKIRFTKMKQAVSVSSSRKRNARFCAKGEVRAGSIPSVTVSTASVQRTE